MPCVVGEIWNKCTFIVFVSIMEKKRILFISQYFYPETFRGNDIAFHWAKKGHDVHVVTGVPNYPKGKFYDGYGLFKKRREVVDGVKVTRLPIIPRGDNKISLMLNYFSYLIVGSIYILFHSIFNKYDFVFCQQLSPVMMSTPAVLYRKLRRVPLITWILDLWPESLTAAGGVKNKYILGLFRLFVSSEYKNSTLLLTSSRSFRDSIMEYGDYENKIVYFPQWGDGEGLDMECNTDLPDLPEGFRVMFAGAIGEAHGFECNMRAALLTKENKNIKWIILGDGRKLPWVKEFIAKNNLEDTVYTLGRFPADTMPYFFKQADLMLVSLNDSMLFNLYAPAKISSYMAAGKPIVTCLNGEGREVVEDADSGWCVKAGDFEALANVVTKLSACSKHELEVKGVNGRRYYENHFDKSKCLERLDILCGLSNGN